jgi:hypothetical protein
VAATEEGKRKVFLLHGTPFIGGRGRGGEGPWTGRPHHRRRCGLMGTMRCAWVAQDACRGCAGSLPSGAMVGLNDPVTNVPMGQPSSSIQNGFLIIQTMPVL